MQADTPLSEQPRRRSKAGRISPRSCSRRTAQPHHQLVPVDPVANCDRRSGTTAESPAVDLGGMYSPCRRRGHNTGTRVSPPRSARSAWPESRRSVDPAAHPGEAARVSYRTFVPLGAVGATRPAEAHRCTGCETRWSPGCREAPLSPAPTVQEGSGGESGHRPGQGNLGRVAWPQWIS